MPSATIYKISKKGFLLFPLAKTVSGFKIAMEPFIHISETDNLNLIAEKIKSVLIYDESKRTPDPKSWTEFNKEFLKKTGLKSLRELRKATSFCCGLRKESGNIILTPTKHAEKSDQGFLYQDFDAIAVDIDAPNDELAKAVQDAFNRCK